MGGRFTLVALLGALAIACQQRPQADTGARPEPSVASATVVPQAAAAASTAPLRGGPGPTNPGEPSFRAAHPVPAPAALRSPDVGLAEQRECPGLGQRVCIVSIGDGLAISVDEIAAYLRGAYYIPVTALAPIDLAGIEDQAGAIVDQQRQQVEGVAMLDALKRRFPSSAADGRVTLIAVTPYDMYYQGNPVPYTYSVRTPPPSRFTIVSVARMDDRGWGQAASIGALRSRTLKLVTREVGAFHFGIPLSSDPASLMNNSFGSRAGVDRAPEHLDLSGATLRPLPPAPVR